MTTETYRDAVAALFKSAPGCWVPWHRIAEVGGAMAWRTRVSDCRLELGMSIDNRVRKLENGSKVSEYRYLVPTRIEQESPADELSGFDSVQAFTDGFELRG